MREGRQEGIKRRAPKILSQIRALEKIEGSSVVVVDMAKAAAARLRDAWSTVNCGGFYLGETPTNASWLRRRVRGNAARPLESFPLDPTNRERRRARTAQPRRPASCTGGECVVKIQYHLSNETLSSAGQHAKPRSSLHIGGSPRPKTIDDAPCSYSMRCARGMT